MQWEIKKYKDGWKENYAVFPVELDSGKWVWLEFFLTKEGSDGIKRITLKEYSETHPSS
jgi:hypothetical protein